METWFSFSSYLHFSKMIVTKFCECKISGNQMTNYWIREKYYFCRIAIASEKSFMKWIPVSCMATE